MQDAARILGNVTGGVDGLRLSLQNTVCPLLHRHNHPSLEKAMRAEEHLRAIVKELKSLLAELGGPPEDGGPEDA